MCPRGVQQKACGAPDLSHGKPATWAQCCPVVRTGMGMWQGFALPWQPAEDGHAHLHLKGEPWQISNPTGVVAGLVAVLSCGVGDRDASAL